MGGAVEIALLIPPRFVLFLKRGQTLSFSEGNKGESIIPTPALSVKIDEGSYFDSLQEATQREFSKVINRNCLIVTRNRSPEFSASLRRVPGWG